MLSSGPGQWVSHQPVSAPALVEANACLATMFPQVDENEKDLFCQPRFDTSMFPSSPFYWKGYHSGLRYAGYMGHNPSHGIAMGSLATPEWGTTGAMRTLSGDPVLRFNGATHVLESYNGAAPGAPAPVIASPGLIPTDGGYSVWCMLSFHELPSVSGYTNYVMEFRDASSNLALQLYTTNTTDSLKFTGFDVGGGSIGANVHGTISLDTWYLAVFVGEDDGYTIYGFTEGQETHTLTGSRTQPSGNLRAGDGQAYLGARGLPNNFAHVDIGGFGWIDRTLSLDEIHDIWRALSSSLGVS